MPSFDIDIDFPTDFKPLDVFPSWVKASIVRDEKITPHPCGVYPQAIAKDPLTSLAAIPYEQAEECGYFKIDMLHLNVYNYFNSREEILSLLDITPDWNILLDKDQVPKIFQLGKHLDLLLKLKPQSIEDVADAIALIRPGKKQFVDLYLKQKETIRKVLYQKTEDGYSFKRSHAIGYAQVVILQLHLIDAGVI